LVIIENSDKLLFEGWLTPCLVIIENSDKLLFEGWLDVYRFH